MFQDDARDNVLLTDVIVGLQAKFSDTSGCGEAVKRRLSEHVSMVTPGSRENQNRQLGTCRHVLIGWCRKGRLNDRCRADVP